MQGSSPFFVVKLAVPLALPRLHILVLVDHELEKKLASTLMQ